MLIFNGRINGLWYGSLFPDAPPIFLDDAQLAHALGGPERVYFVTGGDARQNYLAKIGAHIRTRSLGRKIRLFEPTDGLTAPRVRKSCVQIPSCQHSWTAYLRLRQQGISPKQPTATPAQTNVTPAQRPG